MKIKKIFINNIGVSQIKIDQIVPFIKDSFMESSYGYITVTGAHGIIESHDSEEIKKAHNNSLLTIPDGMPLVYLSKIKGSNNINRCFGPETMQLILEDKELSRKRHFLYGGNIGVAKNLKNKLQKKFNANVVGYYTPPFRPLNEKENNDLKKIVKELKPDIIWVGISCPKQELFMYEYFNKLDVKFMFGVGAAFDYHLEGLKPAPKIVQLLALEWLYRLIQEPKRLFKRYINIVPRFIILSFYDLYSYFLKKS
tara:strand:- start:152 stop:913 length:762 start_codon:yes stop_codon:yes gene_type:complete